MPHLNLCSNQGSVGGAEVTLFAIAQAAHSRDALPPHENFTWECCAFKPSSSRSMAEPEMLRIQPSRGSGKKCAYRPLTSSSAGGMSVR